MSENDGNCYNERNKSLASWAGLVARFWSKTVKTAKYPFVMRAA